GPGESSAERWRLGNEDPDEVVMLLAGIAAGVDSIDLQLLVCGERRNQPALSGVCIEPPAVIAAFHLLTVEEPVRKRHAAVRAGIVQRESPALVIAADGQRGFEQHGLLQVAPTHLLAGQGAIPEAVEHQGVRRLALWQGYVVHEVMDMGDAGSLLQPPM